MTHSQKVAIVTGASSGIGKATVLCLLEEGFKVHAAARRVEAMSDLAEKGALVHHLDLTVSESITSLIEKILAQDGRVDALINNAGYGSYGAVEDVPLIHARDQMEVNLFGPALMIQQVLPTMRKQRSGKIVNVSSIGGKIWSPLGAWYHASKFGLEGLSDCLRNEVRPFGIDVILVEPGGIKTEWGDIAVDNLLKNSGTSPYRELAQAFAKMAKGPQADLLIRTPPRVIAEIIAEAVTVRRPKARYVAPFSGKAILFLRWILCDRAFDWVFGKIIGLPKTL